MELLDKLKLSDTYKKFDAYIKNGKLSHAYILVGEDEVVLKEFCKTIAMRIICQNQSCCGVCDNCKKIKSGFHPDIFWYPKEKSFLVEDSEDIIENSSIGPLESSYKIFIVNRIDISTVQAQNKILKTLESSPKSNIYIFTAVNINAVLPTIKSRMQLIEVETDFNEKNNDENSKFLIDMLKNMTSSKNIVKYIGKFSEKSDFKNKLYTLAEIFEKILLAKTTLQSTELTQLANEFEFGAIRDIFELLTDAKKQLDANVSTNIISDYLLFKILEVKYLWNKKK